MKIKKTNELGSDRHVRPAGLCHLATLILYPSFSSFLNAAKSGMKYLGTLIFRGKSLGIAISRGKRERERERERIRRCVMQISFQCNVDMIYHEIGHQR